jgi:L-arabinonolactonase
MVVEPIDIIPAANTLGEGVVWDSRRAVLWWTDIESKRLYRHDWMTRTTREFETPERAGSFALVAGSERLLVAFETGFAFYDPETRAAEWLARPLRAGGGVRFNDGRVDRHGRFWAGSMREDAASGMTGDLYCVGPGGTVQRQLGDVGISNSLCTSPDGAVLYFADTPLRTIWAFPLAADGRLGARRKLAETHGEAVPDGSTVDAEGYIWNAQWDGSRVVRYAPDGRIERTLPIPTRRPTCVCFGGPHLDLLFVTSARQGLDAATIRREPHAGDVFIYRTGVQGLPEPEYHR